MLLVNIVFLSIQLGKSSQLSYNVNNSEFRQYSVSYLNMHKWRAFSVRGENVVGQKKFVYNCHNTLHNKKGI